MTRQRAGNLMFCIFIGMAIATTLLALVVGKLVNPIYGFNAMYTGPLLATLLILYVSSWHPYPITMKSAIVHNALLGVFVGYLLGWATGYTFLR